MNKLLILVFSFLISNNCTATDSSFIIKNEKKIFENTYLKKFKYIKTKKVNHKC